MSISKFNLAKALRNEAKIVADANSITLVGNGEGFSPDVNESHIEEIVLYGDDDSVGLAAATSDIQFGIYQLSVHSPINQTKWAGLQIVDILQAHFVRELKPSFNGQEAVITDSSLAPMMKNETHLIHHLSIRFSVIA
jgi:hypothetical protein